MSPSPPITPPSLRDHLSSAGLLLLRLSTAAMMLGHGWPKLSEFGAKAATFADPLGVGSFTSLTLAVFAEFFCSIGLALGLATRLAAVPLVTTMLVAVLLVHTHDPWSRKELPLLYAAAFITLILTGPGKFSLDELIARWWRRRRAATASSPRA